MQLSPNNLRYYKVQCLELAVPIVINIELLFGPVLSAARDSAAAPQTTILELGPPRSTHNLRACVCHQSWSCAVRVTVSPWPILRYFSNTVP